LIGGFVERHAAAWRFAAPGFSLEFEIPVLGEILRVREAVGFAADAMIATVQERRALSEVGVLALVDVQHAAHEVMAGRHTRTHTRFLDVNQALCKDCVNP
jgi:hypothetical protein